MNDIKNFFTKQSQYAERIPKGFIDSIIRLYNYNVMQQIKECLFHHNEERISKDIQNYLFATNYDLGEKLICPYTNEMIELTDNFFLFIEQNLFDKKVSEEKRKQFRTETALRFTTSLQSMQADGGRLTIATRTLRRGRPRMTWIEVSFKDAGEGINRETLKSLFVPFFTTKSGGTGLGLPISQRIAENHGGTIRVHSIPGKGSTFTLSIPHTTGDSTTAG